MKTLEIKEAVTEIVEVPRQKEAEPESAPDVIEIEFSEVDRQTAERYININRCLVCTALMNRGHDVRYVGTIYGVIDGERYLASVAQMPNDLYYNRDAVAKPYYGPEVVGKKVILTKI